MLLRLVLSTSLILVACDKRQTAEHPQPEPEAKPSPVAVTKAQPKPPAKVDAKTKQPSKINKRFLSKDLKVDDWVKRFEGESREVSVHRKAIVAALNLPANARIADVGAGTGLFLPQFSKAAGSAGKVYAVDISPRFLEHLRKRVAKEGMSNVEVVTGTATEVKLAAGSVDVVFTCDTYHHFEQPAKTLASIRSALKPGGTLIIVDFHRIPGKSSDWILNHVRAGQKLVRKEIEAAGFSFSRDLKVKGLVDNYAIEFKKN